MRKPTPSVEVIVENDQVAAPVDTERWATLARAVLRAEAISGPAELALRFVEEAEIAELNGTYLGHEGPTDVLSFPIEDEPRARSGSAAAPLLLGDVVICPAVAAVNAPDHAGTYDDEIALLVVHGILHVLGMDHEDDGEAEVMEAREQELLTTHHRNGATA